MTLPSDLYDGLDPTPAASVLAYTDSCTNANKERQMTSPVRSVNADHVNRLMEAVRIGGEWDMEKFLRVASDIGGYTPETDSRYKTNGLPGAADEIERFEWVSRWLGLKDPEAEVLFDLGKPLYTPSGITREHLLAVLEAICDGDPVDRDIWARNDPDRELSGLPPKTTNPQAAGP